MRAGPVMPAPSCRLLVLSRSGPHNRRKAMTIPTARHPKPARLASCALILCFCAVSPAVEAHALSAAAPPVGNGGFETPPTTGQAFQDTGSSLGAWKVTAGSV